MEKEKILEINHMKISFCQYQKGMHQTELPVISDLNVTVRAGEMVAISGFLRLREESSGAWNIGNPAL